MFGRRQVLLVIAILVLLTSLVTAVWQNPAPAQAQKKFAYRLQSVASPGDYFRATKENLEKLAALLKENGDSGWELVGILQGGGGGSTALIFKK
jgi:hypothetical protein